MFVCTLSTEVTSQCITYMSSQNHNAQLIDDIKILLFMLPSVFLEFSWDMK